MINTPSLDTEDDELDLLEIAAPILTDTQTFVAAPSENGDRLDVFLAAKIAELSRSQVQRIVASGGAQVNGLLVKSSVKMVTGDTVTLTVPPVTTSDLLAENIPLDIVYEDADVLVLNKAKGMVVHPAPGAASGTLVNALLFHCADLSGIGGEERPGIVHRIDKDTTGLMVVAKNDLAHRALQAQIQSKTAERRYHALLWGRPPFNEAQIDAAIGRHPIDRKRMAVIPPDSASASRIAQTHLYVREVFPAITLVECVLATGRTHQIRVHCEYIKYPVVADPVYGGERKIGLDTVSDFRLRNELNAHLAAMHGQALHAYSLAFDHPRTGERVVFTLPLPPEMETLVDLLRRAKNNG